jgi:hypothetical protein
MLTLREHVVGTYAADMLTKREHGTPNYSIIVSWFQLSVGGRFPDSRWMIAG